MTTSYYRRLGAEGEYQSFDSTDYTRSRRCNGLPPSSTAPMASAQSWTSTSSRYGRGHQSGPMVWV
ncbi:hypothetical protein A5634_14195 [Mycobacterium asiaticum]|uniref:Uncharacterized protein n=1 Tax=Mycobacterium asiaticum TaxID=1790 RepID=A0A1A3PB51_MYCAS|nr:hypothetical protein A5634_14195 [Mycobacterium asiaticum]